MSADTGRPIVTLVGATGTLGGDIAAAVIERGAHVPRGGACDQRPPPAEEESSLQ